MIIHARTRSKVQGPKKSVNPMVWRCREFFFSKIFVVFKLFRTVFFDFYFLVSFLYFKESNVVPSLPKGPAIADRLNGQLCSEYFQQGPRNFDFFFFSGWVAGGSPRGGSRLGGSRQAAATHPDGNGNGNGNDNGNNGNGNELSGARCAPNQRAQG